MRLGMIPFLLLIVAQTAGADWIDDFEAGSIDTGRWAYGGRPLSYNPWTTDPGNWTWAHTQGLVEPGDTDEYCSLHVTGPESVNSYGALAWLRSQQDYNDGLHHVIDFTWMYDVAGFSVLSSRLPGATVDDHENHMLVEVTNGYLPSFAERPEHHFYFTGIDGSTSLLWNDLGPTGERPYGQFLDDTAKQTWSIAIDPAGTVRMFDGPGGSGALLREAALDPAENWFVRFMVTDSTSEGFPAGSTQLKLYSVSSTSVAVPEPAGAILLLVFAISMGFVVGRRRRGA